MRDPAKKKAALARWRARNREKQRAYTAAWTKANPERARVNRLAYQKRNRKKINARLRAQYAADPSKFRARTDAWHARNLDKRRAYTRNRKARKRNADGFHTGDEIKLLLERQGHLCAGCRISIRGGYHADHIIPLVEDGTNWIENIQLLCADCNLSKGARDPLVWAQENGRLL